LQSEDDFSQYYTNKIHNGVNLGLNLDEISEMVITIFIVSIKVMFY